MTVMCCLFLTGSKFNESLFEGGSRLYFKIVGALLRVSLSFYFRLAKVFLQSLFNIYLWLI